MINSLEKGLFRLCEERIKSDEEFRRSSKCKNFDRVDSLLFQEYRLFRLKKTLQYAYEKSKFYKKLFDDAHVSPGEIRSINDLSKLPFTEPSDIAKGPYQFLCISQGQVEKPVTYTSTGTTGLQKRIFFSINDVENIKRFLGVGMNTVTDERGVIQILLPNFGGRGIGSLLAAALESMGMKAYATGMDMESAEQIKYTLEQRPDVWFGDGATIYRITKEMERVVDLSGLGVKVMFLTMGDVSDTMAKNIERIWNCRVCTHYGLTETGWGLAVDCDKGDGFHYNEFDVIAEVVDPKTGKPLPDGAEGELVFTCIGREAMPLIRYRSRDIATLQSGPCRCGSSLQTMGHVKRRLEGVVTFENGMEIYQSIFDDTLYQYDVVVDYDIFIDRKEEKPRLLFNVEVINEDEGLCGKLEKELFSIRAVRENMMKPKVEIRRRKSGEIPSHEKKLIRELP